jgi:hypothetical protein
MSVAVIPGGISGGGADQRQIGDVDALHEHGYMLGQQLQGLSTIHVSLEEAALLHCIARA